MLLSTELVAVVLFAFVLVKTGPYYSIPHKVRVGAPTTALLQTRGLSPHQP